MKGNEGEKVRENRGGEVWNIKGKWRRNTIGKIWEVKGNVGRESRDSEGK